MMQLNPSHVTSYLRAKLGHGVEVLSLTPLGDHIPAHDETPENPHDLKTFGYGRPVLIRYRDGNKEGRAVLNTMPANAFGHDFRSDRAANLLLSYDTYNDLPDHVPAFDVGVVMPGGWLLSLGEGEEFFLLMPFVEGTAYAHDLETLRDGRTLTDTDLRRARQLAQYLAEIHREKRNAPHLYRRRVRDVVGSGEGIMGLTDSYPADVSGATPQWLEQVESACVKWRWKLRHHTHRLSQVHGDFHPFNILFQEDGTFTLLDRSRGAWGEPADDVSAMAINYLFFSLQRNGMWEPPFTTLWQLFWNTYLAETDDHELLEVIAPFFAWRALVLASPLWYHVRDDVRHALFAFVDRILHEPVFDPNRVGDYLFAGMYRG
jgi:hypothetical protein